MLWLIHSLYESAAMFWEVFWALVLGFTLSGVFQVFVSKAQMTKAFGTADLRSMTLATAFGAASSSCSYAAVATAKTAFKKGAALAPTLAFMFASTNLVFELGFVIWLLLGWQFVLAEGVGAFVLIAVMWLLLRLTEPPGLEQDARAHPEEGEGGHDHDMGGQADRLTQVADAFVMDWSMLWREILIGFLIAGFLSVLVPDPLWRTLFLVQHPGLGHLLENAVVGPLIAVASFVCSVGNIPLASILWSGGISFGGVLAFIYADLIIVPLIVAYKKYYGLRTALYITGVMFVAMVVAGLGVDLLFQALHLVPMGPRPPSAVARAGFHWDYTSYLDIVALFIAGSLAWRHYKSPRPMDRDHAPRHA